MRAIGRTVRLGVALLLAAAFGAAGSQTAGSGTAGPQAAGGLAGRLLVASERVGDPRFARTVILLVRHGDDGALGLVVNRPLAPARYGELFAGLALDDAARARTVQVGYGGPVELRRVFVLHDTGYRDAGTVDAAPNVAMSVGRPVIEALASGGGPARYRLLLGYAGWGPGQLEGEIARGDWFDIEADAELVLGGGDAGKWSKAFRRRTIPL